MSEQNDGNTPADVESMKAQAKQKAKETGAKARDLFRVSVGTLLDNAIEGFELTADDTRTKKELFRAVIQAAALHLEEKHQMSLARLQGTATRSVSKLFAPPALDTSEAANESEDTYESGDDESDDIH